MNTFPLKEAKPCPKCSTPMVAVVGPHGATRIHYAKVACPSCGHHNRWVPWPTSHKYLLRLPDAGRCRSCDHPVLWSVTTSGKRVPLHLDGPPKTIFDADGVAHTGWESHHAHCPNAAAHRNKGGKR